jgi:EAL domain-containing protein (putative c-di-GMP-specific phosphodiesterase class I)
VTVAEGIENRDQASRLQTYGCAQGQGYLFGRPAPAAEIPAMVARFPGTTCPKRAAR